MFKLLGIIVWAIIAVAVWSHWPAAPAKGEVAVALSGRAVDILLLVGVVVLLLVNMLMLGVYAWRLREMERRQQATESFLDDLAHAWLDDPEPPDSGEPVLGEKVVPLFKKRAGERS